MDVQIVAGLAPDAAIVLYFSTFDQKGWVDLLNELIDGKPATSMVLSVSWGLTEDDPDWSKGALSAINERLQALANLGITVCAAAGDDGSGDQETDGRAHVDFPASSPYLLAVGGTMFEGANEVVWWEAPGQRTPNGGGSTGGGVSVEFPRPSWQDVKIASLNPGSIDGRVVPDIAALAGSPLYDLIFTGRGLAERRYERGSPGLGGPARAARISRLEAGISDAAPVWAGPSGAAAGRRPTASTSPLAITPRHRPARGTRPALVSTPSAAGECRTAPRFSLPSRAEPKADSASERTHIQPT